MSSDKGYEALDLLPFAVRQSVMVDGPKVKLAVPRVAQELWRAITAPKRALTGELDPNSPTGVEEATNLGLNLLGAGTTFQAGRATPKGALQMFAGEKSKGADKVKLALAQELEKAQAPREFIWKQTGWFKGVDGKWRYEIDDSQMGLKLKEGSPNRYRSEGVDHPELAKAYPQLLPKLKQDVTVNPSLGHSSGEFDPNLGAIKVRAQNPEEARTMTLHELMHAVANKEGFAPGGNLEDSRALLRTALGREPTRPEVLDAYKKLSAETEARTVEARADYTPYERARRPPWLDYDVPEALQTKGYQTPSIQEGLVPLSELLPRK